MLAPEKFLQLYLPTYPFPPPHYIFNSPDIFLVFEYLFIKQHSKHAIASHLSGTTNYRVWVFFFLFLLLSAEDCLFSLSFPLFALC